jgi:hypothetical protein
MGRGKGYCPFPGPIPKTNNNGKIKTKNKIKAVLHRRLDTLLKSAHTVEYGALFLLFNIRRASVTKPSTGSCFQDDDGRQLD